METKRAKQYIYQNGKWYQAGNGMAITGDGSSDNGKDILLSIQRVTEIDDNDKKFRYRLLHITLLNFEKSDAGKKLFLYTLTRHGQRHFKHHANYDVAKKNVCMGFATIAGTKVPDSTIGDYYSELPSWMPHGGFIQTEWEITSEDIEAGKKVIDLSQEFLPLLFDCDGNEAWYVLGVPTNFKFGLVNDEGAVECMSQSIQLTATMGSSYPSLFIKNNKYYFGGNYKLI